MSAASRIRPASVGGDIIVGGTGASLEVSRPRSVAQWATWQRRRDRYRTALAMWAVERARLDPMYFHPARELLRLMRMLELTRADDRRLLEAYAPRTFQPGGGRRALKFNERRRG